MPIYDARGYWAQRVKTVKMHELVYRYGYDINRAGYISCPFHEERTASLRVWDDHWKCFGCGEYGDQITFVSKLFGLKFNEAIKKINDDFSLGLNLDGPSYADAKRFVRSQNAKEEEKQRKEAIKRQRYDWYLDLCKEEEKLKKDLETYKPSESDDHLHPLFASALELLPRLGYYLDTYDFDGEEEEWISLD